MATVSKWADEDPSAMSRLLRDPELRAQLLAALDDLVPEEAQPGAQSSNAG